MKEAEHDGQGPEGDGGRAGEAGGTRIAHDGRRQNDDGRCRAQLSDDDLALAGLLASVIDGIDQRITPGQPSIGDAYAGGDNTLPATLLDAAEAFLRSPFAITTFGEDVVKHFHALAEFEWREFMHSVTDWERERYLDSI